MTLPSNLRISFFVLTLLVCFSWRASADSVSDGRDPLFDPLVCEDEHPEYHSGYGFLDPDSPMYDFVVDTEDRIEDVISMLEGEDLTWQEFLSELALDSLSFLTGGEEGTGNSFHNKIFDDHYYIDDIVFTNPRDGIELPANISYPKATPPPEGFPVIIVPPGWATNEHMGLCRGYDFTRDYIVIRYTPRGFANHVNGSLLGDGSSYRTGLTDMVGCKDMSDIEAIIDTIGLDDFQFELEDQINELLAASNTAVEVNINSDNLGMMGISYGSLLSLRAVSQLGDKVKVAAALDGGIDFRTTFFEGNSLNWVELTGLYALGLAFGNAPPWMTRLYRAYMLQDFDEETLDFIDETNFSHSPGSYIDLLNASNKPVYIGALWDDQMFKPGQHFEYFEQLDIDNKKLVIQNGTHAYIGPVLWQEVKDFMDYHMLGKTDNGAMDTQVTMTVSNAVDNNGRQLVESYKTWPSEAIQTERLYLKNRSLLDELPLVSQFGSLTTRPFHPSSAKTDHFTTLAGPNLLSEAVGPSTGLPNDIRNNLDVSGIVGGACTLPAMTGFLGNTIDVCEAATNLADRLDESLGMGEVAIVDKNLYLASVLPVVKDSSIIWATPAATGEVQLRGRPSLKVRAKSDSNNATYVAYLYDFNPETGNAQFITHGTYTAQGDAGVYKTIEINLQPIAWNLPKDHKFALALDGYDPQYLRIQRGTFGVTVQYDSNNESYIDLPIKQANTWDSKEDSFIEQLVSAARAKMEAAAKAAEDAAKKAAQAAEDTAEKAKQAAEDAAKKARMTIKKAKNKIKFW